MAEITFNYCGFDSKADLSLIVNDIKRNITPEITENVQDVPAMVGKIFQGNSYGQRIFNIDVTLIADSEEDRVAKMHDLSNLFMQTTDGEFPMIFSDESEYTYYGHISAISQVERVNQTSNWGSFTLTFSCSDPKGYGEYISQDITENPTTITPHGSAECYPIFTCMPKKDMTKIALSDEDGNYVFIGGDVDPDTGDEPVNKEPLVFSDDCNDLSRWTVITTSTLTFNLENGVIGAGSAMRNTANSLRPALTSDGKYQNFGDPVSGKWHGPLIQQWLPASYDDFRIRVRLINQQYYPRAMGKIELYLLNAEGTRIGKIMLKDNGTKSKVVYAQAQLGSDSSGTHHEVYYGAGSIKNGKSGTVTIKVKNGTKTVTVKGKQKTEQLWKTITLDEDMDTSTFTNFYGYIELQKIGNKYTVNIMKLNNDANPAWSKPITATWTDTKNQYGKSLAGIALYCAKYDITEDTANPVVHYHNNDLALCDVKVWEIIDGGNSANNALPVIAHKGDEIKINCEDRTIYKNGDIFMKNLYIGSQFPTLNGGIMKSFTFEPDLSDADWYWEYRPTTQ